MRVQLLYFDDCPNWRQTEQRLRQALQLVGRDHVRVERIRVSTPDQAQAIGFLGSPTVRINGADPFLPSPGRAWGSPAASSAPARDWLGHPPSNSSSRPCRPPRLRDRSHRAMP